MPAIDRAIDAALYARCDVAPGMRAILAVGKEVHPGPAWGRLARIRWSAQDANVAAWFKSFLHKNPVPARVKGFWFGAPEIYMNAPWLDWCGTSDFKLDDIECGWATGVYPDEPRNDKVPPQSICPLVCLFHAAKALGVDVKRYRTHEEYDARLAERHSLAFFAVSLGYTCLIVSHLFQTIDPILWLGRASVCGVAVGFAGGGHHQLGVLSRQGWKSRPLSWNGFDDE
ncbi:MAG: hypothetical protein ACKVU4_05885 [Phycisphaerales bacterium]